MITDRNVPLPQNWSNFLACIQNKSENANFLSVGLKWQSLYDKQIVTSADFSDELEVCSSNDTVDTS